MAFPTSSLTNNQVHKEGNRAFVYDSALGVWDQVRETDRTENKILSGKIEAGVTFPTGHILQVAQYYTEDNMLNFTATGTFSALGNSYYTFPWSVTITTKQINSTVMLFLQLGNVHLSAGSDSANYSFKRTKDGSDEALVGAIDGASGTGGTPGYTTGGNNYGIVRSGYSDQRNTNVRVIDAPADAAGTVLKYTPLGFIASGGVNIGWGSMMTLVVMEIAG